jgi:hypothetical protein
MMKKKKKTKSKAQHLNWKDPYQPGSNLHKFHQAMMKRGGLKLRDFERMIKQTGASRSFILRVMRGGMSAKGWTWEFSDSRDRFVITNVKRTRKV